MFELVPVEHDPFAALGIPPSGSLGVADAQSQNPQPKVDTFNDRFNSVYPELPTTYRPPERWNQGDVRMASAQGNAPVLAYGDDGQSGTDTPNRGTVTVKPYAQEPPAQQPIDLVGSGLASARTPFADALANPELRRLLAASVRAEVGGQGPNAEQAYIESVINRAAARGMPLQDVLTQRAYYPSTTINKLGYAVSPAEQDRIDQITAKVLAGSNLSNFATGNASQGVGFAGGPRTYDPRTGEYFGVEGPDRSWAEAAAGGKLELVQVEHDPFATEAPSAKSAPGGRGILGRLGETWPARMASDAAHALRGVMTGDYVPGQRREDYTDIPPPQGPTQGSTWAGRLLNIAPVASQPNDEYIGQTADLAQLLMRGAPVMAPRGSVGIFGGRLAQTADKEALNRAEEMAANGATREDIWNTTGWFQGSDKKWRFEIPDQAAQFTKRPGNLPERDWSNNIAAAAWEPTKVGDVFIHPEAYKAYPELANLSFSNEPMPGARGHYDTELKQIAVAPKVVDPDLERSVMLHEMQHGVQEKEGFSPGTNPNMFLGTRRETPEWKEWSALKLNPIVQEYERLRSSKEYADELAASNRIWHLDYKPKYSKLMDSLPPRSDKLGLDRREAEVDALMEHYKERIKGMFPVEERVSQLDRIVRGMGYREHGPTQYLNAEQQYLMSSGETEARNVQKRMDWPVEQRSAAPPWTSQEFPSEHQIVVKPPSQDEWRPWKPSGLASEIMRDHLDIRGLAK